MQSEVIINMRKFIIFLIMIDFVCGKTTNMKTPEEVKRFSDFLKSTTNGKAEVPLNSYLEKNQYAWERSGAFEGDMILTKDQRKVLVAEFSGMKNSALSAVTLWPNNTMYYLIDDTHYNNEHISYIEKAIETLQNSSCVKIKPKTSKVNDYVLIQGSEGGCKSHVGFGAAGPQILNLKPSKVGTGCFKLGTIIHELLHSLGFYHMQSTYDRDDYVIINWDKIKPGHEYNFNKYTSNQVTNLGIKYDYDSILHYSEYSFSIDGNKTIVPIQKINETLGQREKLSNGDIIKLNRRYSCPGF